MPHYDFRFTSMEELAAAHRAELAEARLDASTDVSIAAECIVRYA